MNEDSARTVCLVKAAETSTASVELWSTADADWASETAAHVVGSTADAGKFIQSRARLAWDKLLERRPALKRLSARALSRPWLGWLWVLAALIGGVLVDQIGPDKRINLLAVPVLGLLLWNLLVYLILFGRLLARLLLRRPPRLSLIARLIAGVKRSEFAADETSSLRMSFWQEWTRVSLPLAAARASRFLHLAAAAFAIGVIASLYFRGIVNEYRAGWESTFLDAGQLHGLLTWFLGGISTLLAMPLPDPAQLESMRFSAGPGVNAAPWIHRITGLIVLLVLLPRLLLALLAGWRQRWLEGHFPLDLREPYYQRLLGSVRSEVARLVVLPHSLSITPQAALQLQQAATQLFGPRTELLMTENIAFGGEDRLPEALLSGKTTVGLVIVSLAATPEEEHHGALLKKIRAALPQAARLIVLVDESTFLQRFAGQPERLAERRKLWSRFLEAIPVTYSLCDLSTADAAIWHRQLDTCLTGQETA